MNILYNVALVIIAVALFCLIITIHEFGHFSMSKLFKVRVNEFAVGMGPKIFSKKKGETLYSIRAFPIGGFCSIEGEDEESDSPNAFGNKKVWQRILIISMGAILNIVLGLILMMLLLCNRSAFNTTTIAEFEEGAYTQRSGLQVGDTIKSFGGYTIYTDRDLMFAISTDMNVRSSIENGAPCFVDVKVRRNGEDIELKKVNFEITENSEGGRSIKIDFKVEGIQNNVLNLIVKSFEYTVSMVRIVWSSLIGLLTGHFGFNEMSGPVGLATVISQSATQGLSLNFGAAVSNIVHIMVLITVNLGVFNLLPFPALDGGRLVFLFVEGIIRKPIPERYERWVHSIGFVLLMLLMVLVTYSDILRLVTGKGLGG